ncbi:MAG: DedA family protein [Planctomycetes bacterium]|nr:DedA family protein [Planctomycetota bacterium]
MLAFDLQQFFVDWTYVATFLVLFLCGLGLPIPEEVTLVFAGYLAHIGLVNPLLVIAVCAGAILAGDLMPYLAGRIWGERLLVVLVAKRWVTRKRLRKFNQLFLRWRAWAIFFARFFPGVRSVAYYVAGTLRMPVWRFLLFDFIGVLVTVPTFVLVGNHFGEDIDQGIQTLKKYEQTAMLAIGGGITLVILWVWWRRRRRAAEEGCSLTSDVAHPTPEQEGAKAAGENLRETL